MVSTVGSTNTGTGSTSSGDLGAKDISVAPTNNNLNSNWSKIQALKQRKSELEKLLNEKKALLQQIQRQEAQIFGTSNEIPNSNRDTNDSNIKTNSSNLNKPVNSQYATDDINRNSLTTVGNGSLRRKIGTSFKIPKNFTYNNNNINEQQFDGDVEKLMLEKRFHQNVCNALYKLVNDPNLSKSIRRTHRNEYEVAQQKLIAINHNLSLIKKQQRPIKSNTLHTTSPSTNSGFIRSISPSSVQSSLAPGVSMPVSLSNYNNIQTGNLLKPPSAASVFTLQHHHNHNSNIVNNNNNNNNTNINSSSTNSSNNLNTINLDQCNNNTKINCTISKNANHTENLLNGISIGNNNNNLINGIRYGHNYLIKERRNSIKSLPNHESSKLHSDDVSDISLSIVYPMQQASFNDYNSEHHQAIIDQNLIVIDNNISVSHNVDQLQCETSPNTFDGITGQRYGNNSNIVPVTATFLNPILQQTNSGDSLNNRQQMYNSMAIEPNHIDDINKFYHHQHYHHQQQQQPQQYYRYLTKPSNADVARSSGIFTLKKSQDLPDHPSEFQTHSYSQQAVGQQCGLGGYWKTLSNNERVWCSVDSSYDNSTIQHAKSKKLNSSLSHSLRSSSVGNFDTISSGRGDDMIDKVSISSMNSETNKKPREKQWLETSLDGPIIKAKTSDSIPASFNTYKACQNNTPTMAQSPTSYQISATSTLPTCLSSPVCGAHYHPHGYQNHKHHYSYRDPSTSSSASSASVQQSHKLNISPLRSKLSSQSMLVSPTHYRPVPIAQSHIVKKGTNDESNPQLKRHSPIDLISITDSSLHVRSNNLDLQSGSDSPAAIFESTLLKSPIHYHQLSKAPDIRIESPKNMTVVQQAIFMPYKEVTKPFEMSDFYKYSTKFRQKDNINKHQPQIPAGIDENTS